MVRMIALSIIMLLMTAGVSGQENDTTGSPGAVMVPKEDAPEIYIVQKGDTLWDIAEKFFGDPFTWPDIWKKNLYIQDPHWIYPGQKLTLKIIMEKISQPEKEMKPLAEPEPLFIETAPRMESASPAETEEKASEVTTPVEDAGVIQVLRNPLPVYRRESYLRTGFIAKRSAFPKEKVISVEGEGVFATQNDIVIVDKGSNTGVKNGDMFTVYTVGDRVKHTDTGADLGYVARAKGVIEVLSSGEGQMRCRVRENFDPIVEGDFVMPTVFTTAPTFDAWIRPMERIAGTLLAVNDPLISIHINDILYIDRGSVHGVRPGDRFIVYSRIADGNVIGHREILGELQVVNVMETESAVIVVSQKDRGMVVGDRVELNARCRVVYK